LENKKVKSGKHHSILLIFLTIALLLLITPIPFYSLASEQNNQLEIGINYLATHYWYDESYLSDTELDRDLSIFSDNGMQFIIICAMWAALEPAQGSYNYTRFDNLKHVCNEAANYNLRVIIDFHTLMNTVGESWTMPSWLSPRRFNTVFTNTSIRQAWLDFLGNFTNYVKDVENIDSYLMMNEPYRQSWGCDVSIDDFVNLWSEMKTTITSQSPKPVSIKFSEYGLRSPLHFNYDSRIYNLCDYIAVNYFEDQYSNSTYLQATISEIKAHGKDVMISEFGLETNDSVEQCNYYSSNLDLFRSSGVDFVAPWFWRADYEKGPPERDSDVDWTLPATATFDLAQNTSGYPRPAFLLLASPTPTPDPTPVVTPTPDPTPVVTPTPDPTPVVTPTPDPTPTVPEFPPVIIALAIILETLTVRLYFARKKKEDH
jgi:hypothetical protein